MSKTQVHNIEDFIITQFYNDDNDRTLKIENKGEEREINIHFYYPSVFFPHFEFNVTLKTNNWIMPNYGYYNNMGFMIVTIGGKKHLLTLLNKINCKDIRNKIICVGLNKTGTTSLEESMKRLGYETFGVGNQMSTLLQFSNRAVGTSIDFIEKTDFDFYQDVPFSLPNISNDIIKKIPECRYILTKREDVSKWVSSVKKFYKEFLVNESVINYPTTYYTEILKCFDVELLNSNFLYNIFDTWEIDEYEGTLDEKLTQVYENHNKSIVETLNKYNCDWIEIDVSKKGELKKLTEWLGVENKEEDFVWINKTTN